MSLEDIKKGEPYILVEGPAWGDAEFYGKWLLAAVKADALWIEALEDPSFNMQLERVNDGWSPEFGRAASALHFELYEDYHSCSFTVDPFDDMGELFIMMAEMGFFVLTGQRYQMVIPTRLELETVKKIGLKFAQTGDQDYCLHPEGLVVTMPKAEAAAWQRLLRNIGPDQRFADRLVLLEDTNGAG